MRKLAAVLLTSTMLSFTPLAAQASLIEPDDNISMLSETIPAEEMAGLSGGFIDASGFIIRFAVDVRAQIDGALLFLRSFVLDQVNGKLQATDDSFKLLSENLPNGSQAAVVNDGGGVIITNAQGDQTVVLNENAKGLPSSIVNNTANGLNLSQTVALDLTLSAALIDQINLAQQNITIGNIANSVQAQGIGSGF